MKYIDILVAIFDAKFYLHFFLEEVQIKKQINNEEKSVEAFLAEFLFLSPCNQRSKALSGEKSGTKRVSRSITSATCSGDLMRLAFESL